MPPLSEILAADRSQDDIRIDHFLIHLCPKCQRVGHQAVHQAGAPLGVAVDGGKHAEPFLLLYPEERQPPIQLVGGDGETFTKPPHASQTKEILRQDTRDKEQAIIGMDRTGALCPTAGTGLKFRMEVIHEEIKQGF